MVLLVTALLLAAEAPAADSPLLLMPVDGPEASAAAFEAELARALRAKLGADAVVTTTEINLALSAERTKDVLGCDDVACLNEILGALGGRFALGVQLREGTPLSDVTVILRDLSDATRTFRLERRAPSLMPARLEPLATDLVDGILAVTGWSRSEHHETLQPASPRSGSSLEFLSTPTGAAIFLNGDRVGRTPLTLSGLSQGEYRVEIAKRGYELQMARLDLESGVSRQHASTLELERDFAGYLSLGMHGTSADVEGVENGTLALDVAAGYGRRMWGPVELFGLAGYSRLTLSNAGTGARNGFLLGAFAAVSAHLGMLGMVEAAGGETGQIPGDPDRDSGDFALVHIRLKSGPVFRSTEGLALESGVEFGMMSFIGLEVFHSRRLLGPSEGTIGDVAYTLPTRNTFGVRLNLGFFGFYVDPE